MSCLDVFSDRSTSSLATVNKMIRETILNATLWALRNKFASISLVVGITYLVSFPYFAQPVISTSESRANLRREEEERAAKQTPQG